MAIKFSKKPEPVAEKTVEEKTKGVVTKETTEKLPVDNAPAAQVEEVEQPWCNVGFQSSYTHNLGDYKSVKVGISLMIPCKPPEINDVFDFVKEWVDTRLTKEVEDLTS